jgi:hypothetical protein
MHAAQPHCLKLLSARLSLSHVPVRAHTGPNATVRLLTRTWRRCRDEKRMSSAKVSDSSRWHVHTTRGPGGTLLHGKSGSRQQRGQQRLSPWPSRCLRPHAHGTPAGHNEPASLRGVGESARCVHAFAHVLEGPLALDIGVNRAVGAARASVKAAPAGGKRRCGKAPTGTIAAHRVALQRAQWHNRVQLHRATRKHASGPALGNTVACSP